MRLYSKGTRASRASLADALARLPMVPPPEGKPSLLSRLVTPLVHKAMPRGIGVTRRVTSRPRTYQLPPSRPRGGRRAGPTYTNARRAPGLPSVPRGLTGLPPSAIRRWPGLPPWVRVITELVPLLWPEISGQPSPGALPEPVTGGWTKCGECSNPRSDITTYGRADLSFTWALLNPPTVPNTCNFALACFGNQALGTNVPAWGTQAGNCTNPATGRAMSLVGGYPVVGGGLRWQYLATYYRQCGSYPPTEFEVPRVIYPPGQRRPEVLPDRRPIQRPRPLPGPNRAPEPEAVPVPGPSTNPAPAPAPAPEHPPQEWPEPVPVVTPPNPWPWDYPQIEPNIPPGFVPETPRVVPWPVVPTLPRPEHYPGVDGSSAGNREPGLGRNPMLNPSPGYDGAKAPFTRHRPPPRRTRESKMLAYNMPRGLGQALNAITETLDLQKCLYDALPKHLKKRPNGQAGKPNAAERNAIIWREFGRGGYGPTVLGCALVCAATNHVEDKVIGRLGKAGQDLARRHGRATGYAPSQLGKDATKVDGAYDYKKEIASFFGCE